MTDHVRRYAAGTLGIAPLVDPTLPGPTESARETVADHAACLYGAALDGSVRLSDREGVILLLGRGPAAPSIADCEAAQRVATDLLQRRARSAARAVATIEAALAMAGDPPEGATDADLHAVLLQISDLLDGALPLIAD